MLACSEAKGRGRLVDASYTATATIIYACVCSSVSSLLMLIRYNLKDNNDAGRSSVS